MVSASDGGAASRYDFALTRIAPLALAALLVAACARPPTPLRIGVANAPITLDPHLQDEDVTGSVLGHVYEALTAFDPEMRIGPALAERWESPDDLTWRFHLREARFHDGRPLTADDVVASLERARTHPRSRKGAYLVAMASARALDARTVEIVTITPTAILLHKLAHVMVAPRGSPAEIVDPVGSGPYRFEGREADGTIALTADRAHWRHPGADLRFIPLARPEARFQALRDDAVDVAASLPLDEALRVAPPAGWRLVSRSGLSVAVLGVRVDRPPFSDPTVRRGIHLALDRTALNRDLLGGRGVPLGQLVTPSVLGFVPALEAPRADPAEARRLLAAARGDGEPPALEFQPGARGYVEAIARQLDAVGFPVRLEERPFSEIYTRLLAGEARFAFFGFSCGSGDASDLLDGSLHRPDPARGYGGDNFTGYAAPEVDALIEEIGRARNLGARQVLVEQAMTRVMADLPFIPLWGRPVVAGVRDGIAWQPRVDGRVYGWEVARR